MKFEASNIKQAKAEIVEEKWYSCKKKTKPFLSSVKNTKTKINTKTSLVQKLLTKMTDTKYYSWYLLSNIQKKSWFELNTYDDDVLIFVPLFFFFKI